MPAALKGDGNCVARRARQIKRHQALFAQPGVDQGGLAHIGPTRHRQLDAAGVAGLFRLRHGQRQGFEHLVDQRAYALAVGGTDGNDGPQAQLKKLGEVHAFGHALGLVGHHHCGFAQAAQVFGNLMVLCGHTAARVHHKQHHVGFGHGLAGLLGHFFVNATGGVGLKATGVHHDVLVFAVFGVAVMAVARQAGIVGNDGVAGFGQAVEQGRFAHIGSTDQGDNGFHGGFSLIIQAETQSPRRAL